MDSTSYERFNQLKLDRLAEDHSERVYRRALRSDFRPDEFAKATIIAVDQSLAETGVVILEGNGVGALKVLHAHMFRVGATEIESRVEDEMKRALIMFREVDLWLQRWVDKRRVCSIVHEAVPEGGGQLRGRNSSLLTAFIWKLCAQNNNFRLLPPVPARSHKKLLCGNPNASKSEHHAAVRAFMEKQVIGMNLITNEALRDALSIGIYRMYAMKKET